MSPRALLPSPLRRFLPERGQDEGGATHYEGYYARISLPRSGESFAFIGAMARSPLGTEVYAIAFDGRAARRSWVRFDGADYELPREDSRARFGTTRFSPESTSGVVCDVRWDLVLGARARWPGLLSSPLGPALVVPSVQSYWHVASLRGNCTGFLTIGGRAIDLAGGVGYVEKAWGRHFPSAWTWLSAQAFDLKGASLTAAAATASLGNVLGFPAGALCFHDGRRSYVFASHLGDRVALAASGGRWCARAEGPLHRVLVEASCPPEALVELEGPRSDGVLPVAFETLVGTATVTVERRTRRGFVTLSRAHTSLAGLEVGGDRRHVRAGL